MAQIFPKWTNRLPLIVGIGVVVFVSAVVGFFWYYGSPKYTDVGYRPIQPVAFSHKLHAGDLGIDCRYCHTGVEIGAFATVPPTQTCMNCHRLILTESEKLLPVRVSWQTGEPIKWIRIHKLPDFAYFNHASHVTKGIGCSDCHGNVADMDVVEQKEPLSMGWCLSCHRHPEMHIRPMDQVTNTAWTPPRNQLKYAKRAMKERNINPPTDCSTCHR